MQPKAAESLRLATELDRLERDVKMAKAAVSHGQEPVQMGLQHPYRLEERHKGLLQSYARALLREWLQGKLPEISTWAADDQEPLSKRRLQVIAAVQKQIGQWEADKTAGKFLPPEGDAAKYGDLIMDALS